MQTSAPSIQSEPKPQSYKQTGPKTATGKARASQNATKHGLTSRCSVLVGEDPQEYGRFIKGVVESLNTEGAAEEELARQFAEASWKLRRPDRWEAVQARLQATSEQRTHQVQAAALDEQISKERSDLRQLQRHPASDPPLIVELAGMADSSMIYGYQVDFMFKDWLESLPGESPRLTLPEFVKRMDQQVEGFSEPLERPKAGGVVEAGIATVEAEVACHEMEWPAARVRTLIAEMAKTIGITADELVQGAEAKWRVNLQDRVAELRIHQLKVRRTIKKLELQRQDLVVEQAMPDIPRVDLLSRYTGTALRKRDKSFKLLLELQDWRIRKKPTSGGKKPSKSAGPQR